MNTRTSRNTVADRPGFELTGTAGRDRTWRARTLFVAVLMIVPAVVLTAALTLGAWRKPAETTSPVRPATATTEAPAPNQRWSGYDTTPPGAGRADDTVPDWAAQWAEHLRADR